MADVSHIAPFPNNASANSPLYTCPSPNSSYSSILFYNAHIHSAGTFLFPFILATLDHVACSVTQYWDGDILSAAMRAASTADVPTANWP